MQNPQPDTLQENTQAFSLNHLQAVCQHTAYSPTFLVSGWLVFGLSFCRAMPGQCSPATKISIFTDKNACACDPPHPPGGRAAPPCLVSPVSQTPKLSPPTLVDGSPLAFAAPERPACGRWRKSFASNLTRFS